MSIENSDNIVNHCRLYKNQHLSDLQLKLPDNAQTCKIDHLNLITEYIYQQGIHCYTVKTVLTMNKAAEIMLRCKLERNKIFYLLYT